MKVFAISLILWFCSLGSYGLASAKNESIAQSTESETVKQHYVFFGRDRERVADPDFLNNPAFTGAQLTYAWKELEQGMGNYDFSEIEQAIALLESHCKVLWIQLQDTTFNPKRFAVPRYLTKRSKFDGCVVLQYDNNGQPEGQVAMRWHPAVADRFHRLLRKLGERFDGRIAGINLQETAIGVSESGPNAQPGFSNKVYRDSILKNMSALKHAFSKSVSMQYTNFMPGEWLPDEDRGFMQSIFDHARKTGVVIGAPDLMPGNPNQQRHVLKFMEARAGLQPFGIAIQDGNYTGRTGTSDTDTNAASNVVAYLDQYAGEKLKVTTMFWVAQEPYFTNLVVPYPEQHAGSGVNGRCSSK